jgi:type II restriction enzyme
MHLPDVDLIIYDPNRISNNNIVLLSVKVTLRERIAQTAYWKLKLLENSFTKGVQVYFITLDEDETLKTHKPAKKGRAIVECDLDACYVLTESEFEESAKVKRFSELVSDLRAFFERSQNS